jgi:L-amino acid N-acyltransferase YncA
MSTATIRAMENCDGEAVVSIYQEGIETGHATFAESAGSWENWDEGHIQNCHLVAEKDGVVVGWAGLSATSSRCVYSGVAETSLYVGSSARDQGLGQALMSALITTSEAANIWTLTAGIFPENESSIALHQKNGFQILGRRERLGKITHGPMAGQWRDVISLERRSEIAGII